MVLNNAFQLTQLKKLKFLLFVILGFIIFPACEKEENNNDCGDNAQPSVTAFPLMNSALFKDLTMNKLKVGTVEYSTFYAVNINNVAHFAFYTYAPKVCTYVPLVVFSFLELKLPANNVECSLMINEQTKSVFDETLNPINGNVYTRDVKYTFGHSNGKETEFTAFFTVKFPSTGNATSDYDYLFGNLKQFTFSTGYTRIQ